ncbi:MAG: acyl-CoA desaturase [Planctomycetaceae bacterium]|nr:acyl-CoA desaturase [Planctomycetaceae bacterium]
MHVLGVLAFFYFSWQGLATLLVLHFVTACLGVTLGYHRLLTHGSFKVPRVLEFFFSLCGIISGEGSPAFWVATHRKHHALSDQEGDPHSPLDGFWWSHFIWLQPWKSNEEIDAMIKRWAPDMWKDPMQRFLHHSYAYILIGFGAAMYLFGEYVLGGLGLSLFLWGFCLRQVVVYHGTWFVNSATHVWGYRNYETRDQSRNNWWVALLSYGEGWHNNHHAHQRLARHGHRSWELDITYAVIWTLKKLGLATAVQDKLPAGK